MALDELHARRLATVVTVVQDTIDRIQLVLRRVEEWPGHGEGPCLTAQQVRQIRQRLDGVRGLLKRAVQRFGISLDRPGPRQVLAAELSTLWVVLENALPKRLKGYGKEFAPGDKAEWEDLINSLLGELEQIRGITGAKHNRPRQQTPQ
jgi:hypothetical protein